VRVRAAQKERQQKAKCGKRVQIGVVHPRTRVRRDASPALLIVDSRVHVGAQAKP